MMPITIAMNRITTLLVRTLLAPAPFGGLQKHRQFAAALAPPEDPYEVHATPKKIFMPLNSREKFHLSRDGHTRVERQQFGRPSADVTP